MKDDDAFEIDDSLGSRRSLYILDRVWVVEKRRIVETVHNHRWYYVHYCVHL